MAINVIRSKATDGADKIRRAKMRERRFRWENAKLSGAELRDEQFIGQGHLSTDLF